MATVGFVLAQIFGSIALILMVISLQKHTYKDLLKIQLTANALCVFQYLALWSLPGLFTSLVTTARNFIFARFRGRRPPLFCLLVVLAILTGLGIWLYAGPVSLLPIAAGIIYSVAMWKGNLTLIRWADIISCVLYIIYNYEVAAYVGILVSLVEASGAAVALIRNRHQKIRKIRPKTHKQTRRKRK